MRFVVGIVVGGGVAEVGSRDCGWGGVLVVGDGLGGAWGGGGRGGLRFGALRTGRYDSTTTTGSLGVGPLGFGLEVPEDSKKGAWRDWVWRSGVGRLGRSWSGWYSRLGVGHGLGPRAVN